MKEQETSKRRNRGKWERKREEADKAKKYGRKMDKNHIEMTGKKRAEEKRRK